MPDLELTALLAEVRLRFGEHVVFEANTRAAADTLKSTPVDRSDWHARFVAAFKIELQDLLRPPKPSTPHPVPADTPPKL